MLLADQQAAARRKTWVKLPRLTMKPLVSMTVFVEYKYIGGI